MSTGNVCECKCVCVCCLKKLVGRVEVLTVMAG